MPGDAETSPQLVMFCMDFTLMPSIFAFTLTKHLWGCNLDTYTPLEVFLGVWPGTCTTIDPISPVRSSC